MVPDVRRSDALKRALYPEDDSNFQHWLIVREQQRIARALVYVGRKRTTVVGSIAACDGSGIGGA
jgi:hypothetical protein